MIPGGKLGMKVIGGFKATRRQSFRDAKRATNIPTSIQFTKHKFVFDKENRTVYEFNVSGTNKYIIEHLFDKRGCRKHFHGADASKSNPFEKGRYKQYKVIS